jgi:hypothetical protein
MSISSTITAAFMTFAVGSVLAFGAVVLARPGTYDQVAASAIGAALEAVGIELTPSMAERPPTPETHVFDFDGASDEDAAKMLRDIAELQEAGADITFR